MDIKDTLQFIESKKMKRADFVYLGVILLFLIITIFLFFLSTSFIINNVNKIFLQNEDGLVQSLDKDKYLLIEKRLNLPKNIPGENPIVIPVTPDITTPQIEEVLVFDKKSVIINILNSTKKAGAASLLSKKLESDGFSKASTGDSTEVYETTTIFIKNSKKEFLTDVQNIVKKIYPAVITELAGEDSDFDVTIIIGNK